MTIGRSQAWGVAALVLLASAALAQTSGHPLDPLGAAHGHFVAENSDAGPASQPTRRG